MKQALGMIETKGLVALFEATDAMLKSANVEFAGWQSVGAGLVTPPLSCFTSALQSLSTDVAALAPAPAPAPPGSPVSAS